MSEFEFIKMNGLGNDFVIIDQRINELDHSSTEVQHICNRDKGIGCDQLIYIRNSEISDIPLLKFYNSDGGEISACGNGTRCVANYLMEQD
ncbi:diaminopimelate epimerase, partial [Pelagibacterales bacterium SAG-MED32]|nr:diaminopimelate epimerase [Pelagibacterales bacterium SAG-MED32]